MSFLLLSDHGGEPNTGMDSWIQNNANKWKEKKGSEETDLLSYKCMQPYGLFLMCWEDPLQFLLSLTKATLPWCFAEHLRLSKCTVSSISADTQYSGLRSVIFVNLYEWWREREGKAVFHWIYSLNHHKWAVVGPGWSQEPRTLAGSPMSGIDQITRAAICSFHWCFSVGSWIGSGSGTWSQAQASCMVVYLAILQCLPLEGLCPKYISHQVGRGFWQISAS